MRTGWFRQVHVKSRQSRLRRSLLVARRTVLNHMRSIENVVRAITREDGIKLAVLASMLEQLARLTKQVFDIVREEKACRQLMTSPAPACRPLPVEGSHRWPPDHRCIGSITALTYRATIDRPERFARSRHVDAHLGLTP